MNIFNSQIQAYLFDLDGVLIDSLRLDLEVVNQILRVRFQKSVSRETIRSLFAYATPEFWRMLLEECGASATDEDYQEILKEYNALRLSYPYSLCPGIPALLEKLKRTERSLAVVSNNFCDQIRSILSSVNLTSYFDAVIGNDFIKNKKPAPDIYLAAAKFLGVDPKASLAFEDSGIGVQSAKRAGCQVVGVATGGLTEDDLKETSADLIVHALPVILN